MRFARLHESVSANRMCFYSFLLAALTELWAWKVSTFPSRSSALSIGNFLFFRLLQQPYLLHILVGFPLILYSRCRDISLAAERVFVPDGLRSSTLSDGNFLKLRLRR